jgi:RND family efflux transporter MFP subunit
MFKIFLIKLFIVVSLVSTTSFAQEFDAPSGDQNDREIRVQIVAQDEARFLSPMSGLITKVSKRDGELVKKGQTIISYDCQVLQAQLDQARARVNKQNKILSSAKRLKELGSGTATKVSIANAELQEANASTNFAKKQMRDCSIQAPFSGRIAAMMVKPYYSAEQGQPLFNLINNNKLETEMIVPSKWMSWFKKGDSFKIKVDETGETYSATLNRFGGQVDPVSQSVKAYGSISGKTDSLLSGMSGVALIINKNAVSKVNSAVETQREILTEDKDMSLESGTE